MRLVLSEGGLMFGFMFSFLLALFGGIMLDQIFDFDLDSTYFEVLIFSVGGLLTFPSGLAFTGIEVKNYHEIWHWDSKSIKQHSQTKVGS